jgi:hypothetical protein
VDNKHLLSLLQTNFRTVHVIFDDVDGFQDAPWNSQQPTQAQPGKAQPRRNEPVAPQQATTRAAPQRAYVYKCHNSMEVSQGQQVVVMTDYGLRIVTVVKVDDFADIDLNADYDYKWVVSVIDTAVYDDLLDKEAKFNRLVTEARRTKVREETLAAFKSVLPTEGEAAKLFHEAFNLFDVNNAKPVVS